MTALALRVIKQILGDKRTIAMMLLAPILILTLFATGTATETIFDNYAYIFLSIIAFFLIFIVSGMALVRERVTGTLERMLMTPVTRTGIVTGYALGYGLFAAIQAVVLVLFTIYVLGAPNKGNIFWIIIIMLLLAIAAVSFGELLSIFSTTEFQVVQLIPLTIVPQIFFSGIIPLDSFPSHLGNLAYIMPIYLGAEAVRIVMKAAGGFSDMWHYMAALLAYIIALNMLNALALRKYRKT